MRVPFVLRLCAAGLAALGVGVAVLLVLPRDRAAQLVRAVAPGPVERAVTGQRWTVDDRLDEFGAAADARLRPAFEDVGVAYPPAKVRLAAFKDSRTLELYAASRPGDPWRYVLTVPVLAASGGPGPKLREGDLQVPEGIYPIESLNPNSAFHVSLRVGYPNADDVRRAREDGRDRLGGDIMIHGKASSVGCLAMGDEVAEDLFTLAARTGVDRVDVVIGPVDLRRPGSVPPAVDGAPSWLPERYAAVRAALAELPPPA